MTFAEEAPHMMDLDVVIDQYDPGIILVGPLLGLWHGSSCRYFEIAGSGRKVYHSIELGIVENEREAQRQRAEFVAKLETRFLGVMTFGSRLEMAHAAHARWPRNETAEVLILASDPGQTAPHQSIASDQKRGGLDSEFRNPDLGGVQSSDAAEAVAIAVVQERVSFSGGRDAALQLPECADQPAEAKPYRQAPSPSQRVLTTSGSIMPTLDCSHLKIREFGMQPRQRPVSNFELARLVKRARALGPVVFRIAALAVTIALIACALVSLIPTKRQLGDSAAAATSSPPLSVAGDRESGTSQKAKHQQTSSVGDEGQQLSPRLSSVAVIPQSPEPSAGGAEITDPASDETPTVGAGGEPGGTLGTMEANRAIAPTDGSSTTTVVKGSKLPRNHDIIDSYKEADAAAEFSSAAIRSTRSVDESKSVSGWSLPQSAIGAQSIKTATASPTGGSASLIGGASDDQPRKFETEGFALGEQPRSSHILSAPAEDLTRTNPLQKFDREPPSAPPEANIARLNEDQVAALVSRGADLLNNGDLISARLLLRRAAEAGNANAALMLGATFDPLVIQRRGAFVTPDVSEARKWYQRAAELGSGPASNQLANLANWIHKLGTKPESIPASSR